MRELIKGQDNLLRTDELTGWCVVGCSYACLKDIEDEIETNGRGIEDFTKGYKYYGVRVQQDNSIICREWAPAATQLYLTGDFSKLFGCVCIL